MFAASDQYDKLSGLAADLVRVQPRVIIAAGGTGSARRRSML
jgi:hypothetical protein